MEPRQRWTVALAFLANGTTVADGVGILPVSGAVATAYHTQPRAVSWAVIGYLLASALLLALGGQLGDRYGRRRVAAVGWGVVAASSALCASVPDIGWLAAARAVQGAGSALALVCSGGQLRADMLTERFGWLPDRVAPGLALAVVPLSDGLLAWGPGPRWIFVIDAVIGVVGAVIALLRTSESRGNRRGLDGAGLAAIGVGGLAWALPRSAVTGWGAAQVWIPLVVAGLALAVLLRWRIPMGSLLHARTFLSVNAADLLLFGALYGSIFAAAQVPTPLSSLGALGAGLFLLPLTVSAAWPLVLLGRRWDLGLRPNPRVSASGLLLHAAGLVMLAVAVDARHSRVLWFTLLAVSGVGVGTVLAGERSELFGTSRFPGCGAGGLHSRPLSQTGAALGIAFVGAFSPGLGVTPHTGAPESALCWAAVLAVAGAIANLAVPVTRGLRGMAAPRYHASRRRV